MYYNKFLQPVFKKYLCKLNKLNFPSYLRKPIPAMTDDLKNLSIGDGKQQEACKAKRKALFWCGSPSQVPPS